MNFFGELYKNCDARDGYLEIRTLPDRRQFWLTSPVLSQDILDLSVELGNLRDAVANQSNGMSTPFINALDSMKSGMTTTSNP